VATTGGSMLNGIKFLKEEGVEITDAFVIINRMEGADSQLKSQGVKLHQLMTVLEIATVLHKTNSISDDVFEKVKNQVN
jgi:orotate phosphoribosyltransferase